MKKKSIRLQVAITTILLIAVTILICVLANALFLGHVYTNNKKQDNTNQCCSCVDCLECDVCCECDNPYLN